MPDPTPPPLPRFSPPTSLWREVLNEHDDLDEGDQRGNQKIGGWLIVFAIGRVLAPFFLASSLLTDLGVFIKPNLWAALTTPGSAAYHPLWATAILYETSGNTLLLLFSIVLVALFFARWRAFLPMVMAYMVILALFYWGDFFLGEQIPAVSSRVTGQELGTAIAATVTALIWVPYFLVSVRVRWTFVK